jgi:hypothetical protein
LVAPVLNRFGQLFQSEFSAHADTLTYDSVTVNSAETPAPISRKNSPGADANAFNKDF